MSHLRPNIASLLCSAAIALSPVISLADNDAPVDESAITVTATRTQTTTDKVASSVTIVTRKQLEASHQTFVLDALRSVPGIYLAQTGGPGGLVSVFLRGGRPGDTLVMIDGVPVNDPSSPDRSFDFSNLLVDNIDRIEVLRGAQSTLYGSDAMAGVINIITERGGENAKKTIRLSAGRYRTAEGTLSASGESNGLNYSAAVSRYTTDGFPLADLQPGDTHNDGYSNTSFSARLQKQFSDALSVTAIDHYIKGNDNYADAITSAVDDGIHVAKTEEHVHQIEARYAPLESKWDTTFGLSSNTENRNYIDQVTGQDSTLGHYNGQEGRASVSTNYSLNNSNLITLGAETRREQSDFSNPFDAAPKVHANTLSYYAQDQLTVQPNWLATIGGRVDHHETFGTKATYRLTTSYQMPNDSTRFTATYGTGFKAPSLFQLYDPFSGNANLNPEESKSFDIGVEQQLCAGKGALTVTYFKNNYNNLIDYSSSFKYINTKSAETHGFEVIGKFVASSKLSGTASYTYTHTQDDKGVQLLRRPENSAELNLLYQSTPRLSSNLEFLYVGQRNDIKFNPDFSSTVIQLPGYGLVNIAATYKLSNKVSAFARVDNLLDKHYEEIYSYATAGRGLYGGVSSSF